MPNWVAGRLSISGENSENIIRLYLSKNEDDNVDFDFDKILPMPQDLNIISGTITDDCIKIYLSTLPLSEANEKNNLIYNAELFHFGKEYFNRLSAADVDNLVKRHLSLETNSKPNMFDSPVFTTKEDMVSYGKRAVDNIKKYGAKDWYDWCIKNWGTKWNACHTCYNEECPEEIYFETAWSDVRKLIMELSKKHPKNIFKYDFANEGIGEYSGTYTIKDGKELENVDYEDYTREAYEKYFELWGDALRDDYVFNPETNSYEYVMSDDSDEEM